jgi:hypothetical protein
MEAIVFYPENEEQLKRLMSFASDGKIQTVQLTEEEKRRLAAILLANLAQKNPNAYATDEEIISVVEEVRHKRYGKRN